MAGIEAGAARAGAVRGKDRRDPAAAVLARLGGLVELAPEECTLIGRAAKQGRALPARRSIVTDYDPFVGPLLVLSGWVARSRQFADGRRQVLSLYLPGDVMHDAIAHPMIGTVSLTTVTDTVLAKAPEAPDAASALARAYRKSRILDESYLLRQIGRLGQLDARERILDWLLELRDRLATAGLGEGEGGYFTFPPTQEFIGDALGLTSVHVNRMLQSLRRDGAIEMHGGGVRILEAWAIC